MVIKRAPVVGRNCYDAGNKRQPVVKVGRTPSTAAEMPKQDLHNISLCHVRNFSPLLKDDTMILICLLTFNFVVAGSTSPNKGCATRGISICLFSKLVWQTRGQNRHLDRLATKCKSFSDPTTSHFPVVLLFLSNQSLVWPS